MHSVLLFETLLRRARRGEIRVSRVSAKTKDHCDQNKGRWHQPKVMRTLRIQRNMSQTHLADAINKQMIELMPETYHSSMALTQSMISDLELGRTSPSLPVLYAMATFFEVDMNELLVPDLKQQTLTQSTVTIMSNQDNEISTNQIAILSSFPSPLFDEAQPHNGLGAKKHININYTEIYTLPSLMNFMFAPTISYTRQDKVKILQAMSSFFSRSIYRSLYFSSKAHSNTWQALTPSIFKSGKKISYLLPDSLNTTDSAQRKTITLTDEAITKEIETIYLNQVDMLKDSMILLQIAIQTLELNHANWPMDAMENFYHECVRRTYDAEAIKRTFCPEMQTHLTGLETASVS